MPSHVPHRRDIGIDQNGTVEILHDRRWESILLPLINDQSMCILVNVFDAPALDSQMVMNDLDWWLVLLERNLNDFEGLPAKIGEKSSKDSEEKLAMRIRKSPESPSKSNSLKSIYFFFLKISKATWKRKYFENSRTYTTVCVFFSTLSSSLMTRSQKTSSSLSSWVSILNKLNLKHF